MNRIVLLPLSINHISNFCYWKVSDLPVWIKFGVIHLVPVQNFPRSLTCHTPRYAHVCVCIRGLEMLVFFWIFCVCTKWLILSCYRRKCCDLSKSLSVPIPYFNIQPSSTAQRRKQVLTFHYEIHSYYWGAKCHSALISVNNCHLDP